MNISLDGRNILMTGALGAIAEAIIKTLHDAGAHLVLTDKTETTDAKKVLSSYGIDRYDYFSMDITDPEQVSAVVDHVFQEVGPMHIALGHAGGTGVHPFENCPQETFDQIFALNFTGQTYLARAIMSQWREHEIAGHLVYTSSFVSKIPMAGISAYVSAKAALEMFAKNLALEYAPHGIRANCISPGNVAAGSSKLVYDTDETYRAWVDRVSPLGKRNSSQGIANAFLYLCSDLGNELDGHVLQVDQGVGLPKLG